MSTITTAAPGAELTHKILISAARLVAAMRDPSERWAADSLSLEIRDSLDCLEEELNQAGLLAAYKRDGGGLAIW